MTSQAGNVFYDNLADLFEAKSRSGRVGSVVPMGPVLRAVCRKLTEKQICKQIYTDLYRSILYTSVYSCML